MTLTLLNPTTCPPDSRLRRRVLVVDDEPTIRTLARVVLEMAGYEVTLAGDGDEALDHFGTGDDFDLVLLDYFMPRRDGLQTFHELRERRPEVRVIFSSGYIHDADRDAVLAHGGEAFLPKPYRPQELLTLVREVLA